MLSVLDKKARTALKRLKTALRLLFLNKNVMNEKTPDNHMAEWERARRLIYLPAVLCAVSVFMLSWFFRDPDDIFIAVLYPAFSVIIFAFFPILLFRLISIAKFEFFLMTLAAVIILSRLAWHFHVPEPVEQRLLTLAGGHYWAVGILIIAAYAVFGQKAGLFTGIFITSASAVLALTGILKEIIGNSIPQNPQVYVYLLRIHLFLILILLLTHLISGLRARFFKALGTVEELNRRVKTDLLTGLPNRRALEEFLDKKVTEAERYGKPLSLIIADIDNFKCINDNYGHRTGDKVLKQIAETLSESTRSSDYVARWGGEEFYIVASHTENKEALNLAERVRNAVYNTDLAIRERITVSAGVTEFKKGETRQQLERRADNAMYNAKVKGRNQSVLI